ncbi:hypothetical protein BDN72DRAFT_963159 [Pluteus cervinus]|uniref:Uncharacterized protein n=1 Tax=Pluteus cervinus TaxID=181527 RepID=A0ACD3AEZ2_9AGAR|nr:hypothetical protein BDN72DRAFT_963159 [Pluteus cervinus]
MMKTLGLPEVLVGLWAHEDDYKLDGSEMAAQMPPEAFVAFPQEQLPSFLLYYFMENSILIEKLLSGVEDIPDVAQRVIRRLRDYLKNPDLAFLAPGECSIFLGLVEHFFHASHPKLFEAVTSRGAGVLCTKLSVIIASRIQKSYPERHQALEVVLVGGFRCILQLTQAPNGIFWIIQAVNSGILSALVGSSPVFHDLEELAYTTLSVFFSEVIPEYLCYRSVVEAVDAALQKLKQTAQLASVPKSRAWQVINRLTKLRAERKALLTITVKALKRTKSNKCSNGEYKIVDTLNNFRKCGNCLSSFYCSKECQTAHWKNGHKICCERRRNPEDDTTSYRNAAYLDRLSRREVVRYRPYLKSLAASKYPGVPLQELVMCIDLSHFPVTHKLMSKSELPPEVFIPPVDLYRTGDSEKSGSMILTIRPRREQAHISYYNADIWTLLSVDEAEPPLELDPTGSRYIDLVEISGLEKWREYWAGVGVDVEAS